jgi:hypothetical protein
VIAGLVTAILVILVMYADKMLERREARRRNDEFLERGWK